MKFNPCLGEHSGQGSYCEAADADTKITLKPRPFFKWVQFLETPLTLTRGYSFKTKKYKTNYALRIWLFEKLYSVKVLG